MPIGTNAAYGWNVHPYATPDLVKMFVDETVTIEVLKNDFDSNGDDIRISTFDAITPKGGSVTMSNGNLVYTPAAGFIGRDEFNYIISDGQLFNTTWVQVDVSKGSLEMHYDFEVAGNTIQDQSGANLNGESVNFTASLGTGLNGTNAWVFPDLGGINTENDNDRAFLSFGDVIDPMDGSHSVSIWFKIDPLVLTGPYNCHIVSNSSTAVNKLISGYNIYIDKDSKRLIFEALEQLSLTDGGIEGTQLDIIGDVVAADTWIHTVLVFDRNNNEMRAYMNGNQVGNTLALREGGMIKGKPNGDRYTSGALGICTYKPKKFTPFIGLMDEFRVYGRPITPSEIDTLLNNPTGTIDKAHLVLTQIPADIDLACGASADLATTGEVRAYSPCYPAINITYEDVVAANRDITRTWTVTDDCDAPLTHIQQINYLEGVTLPYMEDIESFTHSGTTGGCNPSVNLGGALTNLSNSEFANDNTVWRVNNGTGISSTTGPIVDYTEGTDEGQYLYLRGSNGCGERTGALLMDCVDLIGIDTPILKFAYQAIKTNGDAAPELHIDVFSDGVWTEDVFQVTGEQGARNGDQTDWAIFEVKLHDFANKAINIRIWGTSSTNGTSCDLALDGIELFAGCPAANLTLSEVHNSAKNYKAMEMIESNSQIESAVQVEYVAGQEILLKPDFHAVAGTNFIARIATIDCVRSMPLLNEMPSESREKKTKKPLINAIKPTLKAYPNPTNGQITIDLEIPDKQIFSLGIYDFNGRFIRNLNPPKQGDRKYLQSFHLDYLMPGIYFLHLQTNDYVISKKLVLVK